MSLKIISIIFHNDSIYFNDLPISYHQYFGLCYLPLEHIPFLFTFILYTFPHTEHSFSLFIFITLISSYLFCFSFTSYLSNKSARILSFRTSSGFFIRMTMLSKTKKGFLIALSASNILPYCFRYRLRGSLGSYLSCN